MLHPDTNMFSFYCELWLRLNLHSKTYERGVAYAHSLRKSGQYHVSSTVICGGVAALLRTCRLFKDLPQRCGIGSGEILPRGPPECLYWGVLVSPTNPCIQTNQKTKMIR